MKNADSGLEFTLVIARFHILIYYGIPDQHRKFQLTADASTLLFSILPPGTVLTNVKMSLAFISLDF